jgi:TolA-binding protein
MPEPAKSENPNVRNVQKSLEKQISELRSQIGRINKSIEERGAEITRETIEAASARASRAAKSLAAETQSISDVARENPGTTSAALGLATLLGFVIGIAVGMASRSPARRYWS